MNSIMERWIGSCRRELLDRTLIWNQTHLMTVLREYEDFYNTHRPHRTLKQAAPLRPLPDGITDLAHFQVQRRDRAGGVIHEYRLVAQVFGTYNVTAAGLGELLHRASRSFARRGLAGFAEHGLSPARVRLVVAVGEAPGIRMRDLAEQLGVTARAVTPLVDGLEGEGLILRTADPADRRAFRLHLTETGEGLRSVISDLQEKVSDDIFRALNQTDRYHLAGLLRKLVTS